MNHQVSSYVPKIFISDIPWFLKVYQKLINFPLCRYVLHRLQWLFHVVPAYIRRASWVLRYSLFLWQFAGCGCWQNTVSVAAEDSGGPAIFETNDMNNSRTRDALLILQMFQQYFSKWIIRLGSYVCAKNLYFWHPLIFKSLPEADIFLCSDMCYTGCNDRFMLCLLIEEERVEFWGIHFYYDNSLGTGADRKQFRWPPWILEVQQ